MMLGVIIQGIMDTKTVRAQASKSNSRYSGRTLQPPTEIIKGLKLQLCTACLFCPFQMPRGETIFFLLPKHQG